MQRIRGFSGVNVLYKFTFYLRTYLLTYLLTSCVEMLYATVLRAEQGLFGRAGLFKHDLHWRFHDRVYSQTVCLPHQGEVV